jgi:hypothetical protein
MFRAGSRGERKPSTVRSFGRLIIPAKLDLSLNGIS